MAEVRKRPSLHNHPSSRDEKPEMSRRRDDLSFGQRGPLAASKKAPGDMKDRHRAERVGMFQAHRSEVRDMSGNHAEENRQMHNRHEKAIADLQAKHEMEKAGAPRWRQV